MFAALEGNARLKRFPKGSFGKSFWEFKESKDYGPQKLMMRTLKVFNSCEILTTSLSQWPYSWLEINSNLASAISNSREKRNIAVRHSGVSRRNRLRIIVAWSVTVWFLDPFVACSYVLAGSCGNNSYSEPPVTFKRRRRQLLWQSFTDSLWWSYNPGKVWWNVHKQLNN